MLPTPPQSLLHFSSSSLVLSHEGIIPGECRRYSRIPSCTLCKVTPKCPSSLPQLSTHVPCYHNTKLDALEAHLRHPIYRPAAEPSCYAESLLFPMLAPTPSLWYVHANSRCYRKRPHNTPQNEVAQQKQAKGHRRCKMLVVVSLDTCRAQPFLLSGLITFSNHKSHSSSNNMHCRHRKGFQSRNLEWTKLFYTLKLLLYYFRPYQNLPHNAEEDKYQVFEP